MFGEKQENNKLMDIRISDILPNRSQPRKVFKTEELMSLAKSIQANGILQPLTVRKIGQGRFELIAGERRLRAAKLAGFHVVPCILMRCSPRQSAVFAIIENMQRSDLNMFEEAAAIKSLMEQGGFTQCEVAQKLGKKQSTIANKLRLLKLSDEHCELILNMGLTERHARVFLKLEPIARREAIERAFNEKLNVSQTEKLVKEMLEQHNTPKKISAVKKEKRMVVKDVRIFMNTLKKAVETMKICGIDAVSQTAEDDDYIEYRIKIPKNSAFKTENKDISA